MALRLQGVAVSPGVFGLVPLWIGLGWVQRASRSPNSAALTSFSNDVPRLERDGLVTVVECQRQSSRFGEVFTKWTCLRGCPCAKLGLSHSSLAIWVVTRHIVLWKYGYSLPHWVRLPGKIPIIGGSRDLEPDARRRVRFTSGERQCGWRAMGAFLGEMETSRLQILGWCEDGGAGSLVSNLE